MFQDYDYFNLVKSQSYRRTLLSATGDMILEIVFPEGDKVRSRTIVSRSRARPTGKYPSWKMGRMIQWESHNELNAYRLLDANPDALAYHEQPLVIRFILDGETHIHYPDVVVQWGHSRELWEIKPSSEASKPNYVRRTQFLEAALPKLGFAYRMVLAEDLGRQPRLANVLTILKHGTQSVSDLAREQIRQILAVTPAIYWQAATNGDLGPNGRTVLSRLTLEGVLTCDLDHPLAASTCFSFAANKKGSLT